jgi:predicted RNase H-like nuclease (RuvC/YqgF family)
MADSKINKLRNRVENLERENRNLRKKISQYKKLVSRSADILLDNFENNKDLEIVKKEKIKFCSSCGKGEIKEIKFLDIVFEVCQLCKERKKIK